MRLISALALSLTLASFCAPPSHAADKIPNFNLEKMDGGRSKLADFLGEGPVLLNFWATWCKPCKQEAPHLIELYEEYRERGLQVVAIAVDDVSSQAKVKPAARKMGLTYPVLLDPKGRYAQRLQAAALPTNVLLDRDGNAVRTFTGYRKGDEREIAAEITKLLTAQQ